jgi:RimJ/RimL family protein N-acetyltransferase
MRRESVRIDQSLAMAPASNRHPASFLKSPRLGFRRWHASDLPLALGLWSDPAVTRFISSGGFTEPEVRNRLERELASEDFHGIQYWPVFLLADGEHVGCCGLRPRQGQPRVPEFGVHIASGHWRRGYALEAATCVIHYAFNVLSVQALFAGHHPQNAASRNLLLRLGFAHTHDEFYEPTGLEHPSYLLTATMKTAA